MRGGGVCSLTEQENPSDSPFGLPAPLSGEPRRLRRSGRLLVDPYRWRVPFNEPLSPVRFRADAIRPCCCGGRAALWAAENRGNYLFYEFLKHFFVGNGENKKMVVSSIKMM